MAKAELGAGVVGTGFRGSALAHTCTQGAYGEEVWEQLLGEASAKVDVYRRRNSTCALAVHVWLCTLGYRELARGMHYQSLKLRS